MQKHHGIHLVHRLKLYSKCILRDRNFISAFFYLPGAPSYVGEDLFHLLCFMFCKTLWECNEKRVTKAFRKLKKKKKPWQKNALTLVKREAYKTFFLIWSYRHSESLLCRGQAISMPKGRERRRCRFQELVQWRWEWWTLVSVRNLKAELLMHHPPLGEIHTSSASK